MSLLTLLEKRSAVDRRVLAGLLAPAAILLGVLLRLLDIGAESYWLDEVKMLEVAGGSFQTLVDQALGGRPPVFVFMAHVWLQWFGTGESAARMLSALAGMLALLLMYLLGRDLFGRRISLIATFLMAISEFQIQQSQNFRYYSVFMVFALLSFLLFVRALRTGGFGAWAGYVVATILTFYSHTHGIFLVAAQGLYFVLQARRYRAAWLPWFLSQVAIFMVLLPGLYIAFFGAVGGTSNVFQWIPDPRWYAPFKTMVKFVLPGRHAPALLTLSGALLFAVVALLLFIRRKGASAWAETARGLAPAAREWLSRAEPRLLLLTCWLVVPLVLPLALSKVFGPMYVDRYLIGASPALYLLIALVLATLRKAIPVLIPLGALVILVAPGLYEYYVTPTNEQWREAAAYLHQNTQPGDRFIFAPGENGAMAESLGWYYRASLPGCGIEAAVRDAQDIAKLVPDCVDDSHRVWLIVRGLPERTQPYRDFFIAHPPATMRVVPAQHLKDVDVYQLQINTQ